MGEEIADTEVVEFVAKGDHRRFFSKASLGRLLTVHREPRVVSEPSVREPHPVLAAIVAAIATIESPREEEPGTDGAGETSIDGDSQGGSA